MLFFLPLYFWVFQMNFPLMSLYLEEGNTAAAQSVLVQMIYGIAPCLILLSPA
jgi:hypothetical protein